MSKNASAKSDDGFHRPSVATDIVLFTDVETRPRVLLITRKNPPFQDRYAFPGGFLDAGESLEQCAARELEEETTLTGVQLSQLGAFSAPDRDPRDRVISVAFVGIVDAGQAEDARPADDAASTQWVHVDTIRDADLAFDHAEILDLAKARLALVD